MDRSTDAVRSRLSSSLGKRGAAEAGMDDAGALRRYHDLESRHSTLERKLIDSQRTASRIASENEDLREQLNELKQNRTNWLDTTNTQRTQADKDVKDWEQERAKYQQELKELRTRSSRTRDENEMLKSECASLSAKLSQVEGQTSAELAGLKGRLAEVEAERDELKEWRRRAANLSLQLEEAKRRAEAGAGAGSEGAGAGVGAGTVDQDLRKTLSQQKEKLSLFSTQLDTTRSELVTLRREKQEWLGSRKQQTETETRLRSEVQVLHGQLERARRDMDSLTLSFPADESSSGAELQAKLTSLSALHHQATADVAARDTEIAQLQSAHAEYVTTSRITISDLGKQNTTLSRELRWATQGRIEAERREQLAKKELETYEGGSGSSGMPGGLSSGPSAQRLQALVDEYKSELDRVARDSRDLEAELAEGAGLVKSSLLDEAHSRVTALEIEIANLQGTITQLTAANTTLDAEVNDLMRRVASGEYNTATERVVELRDNPATRIMAVRKKQLEDLRRENEALLRAGAGAGAGGAAGGGAAAGAAAAAGAGAAAEAGAAEGATVPRESWDRLVKEKEEMEQAHQKRLQRLKEIFGNKSKEFLEAVYSLLGWRIKFDESGADVRLSSMYAPKGKMGLTIKFSSQEGHFGTMQMTGGMSKGLEESRHFWVVERQSVPGFLAQVTTEMFEKTTMGQKAGYVGWE